MDYWLECIKEAFEDAGIIATEEQIRNVTGWVEGAYENYGMASGHDCIPNPMISEIEKLKMKHKEEIKDFEKTIHTYRNSVSTRRNVPIEDVHIDNGDVIYGKSL